MIRLVLTGVLAVAPFALSAPASAESALEFARKEAAERAAIAKPDRRAEARTDRRETRGKERKRAASVRNPLLEGRASSKGLTSNELTRPQGGGLTTLVAQYAAENGVPYDLAHGVVMVESRYNAKATGPGGYIGLMQLSFRTARGMGYSGSRAGLYDPETNLRYGMKYLGEAYRQAGGNMCGAVSKYQGGHGVRGVTKAGAVYCGKVRTYMAREAPVERQQVASREAQHS